MSDEQQTPATRARLLSQQLRDQGHASAADHLDATLAAEPVATEGGHGFLHALRDACQTVLTAIEAIDPVSFAAIDELRLEVDRHLLPHGEATHGTDHKG